MKLVEIYFAARTIETYQDTKDFKLRYYDDLKTLNDNFVIDDFNIDIIKKTILEILQDFDVKEVLDQAETLFNDVLRHEAESKGKLSPTMAMLCDESLKIEKEFK